MLRILVVEDSLEFLEGFRAEVGEKLAERAELDYVHDIASAREAIRSSRPDLLLLDIVLPLEPEGKPHRSGGPKLLAELPELAPGLPVVILSGQDRREAVQLLLSRRVDGYLFKDYSHREILVHLEKQLEQIELRSAHRLMKEGMQRPLVAGESAAFQEVLTRARQVAPTRTTVLVLGESGCGKEVMARFLHAHSDRADGPFRALSCGALPEALAEAELFGARKGAYTGLDRDRDGAMAQARGGTLFLDEIGELPLELQPKLLRALQEKTFRPLGSEKEVKADFRLICATHRDLEEQVREGRFRQDLLFRVNTFPLTIPPLRERPEDLPALVEHLVERFNQEMGKRIQGVGAEAITRLKKHPWPGNVRELVNVLEYAFVVEQADQIQPGSLPRLSGLSETSDEVFEVPHLRPALEEFERTYLQRALARNGWHLGRTAEDIDVPRRTLQNRMSKLGIRVRDR